MEKLHQPLHLQQGACIHRRGIEITIASPQATTQLLTQKFEKSVFQVLQVPSVDFTHQKGIGVHPVKIRELTTNVYQCHWLTQTAPWDLFAQELGPQCASFKDSSAKYPRKNIGCGQRIPTQPPTLLPLVMAYILHFWEHGPRG